MTIALLSLAVSMLTAATSTNGVCGEPTASSNRIVVEYVSSPSSAEARALYHVPVGSPGDVHLLTSVHDAEACARLLAEFNRWWGTAARGGPVGMRPVYYTAGGYYYVVLARTENNRPPPPPGYVSIDLRWVPLLIFDSDFRLLGSIAS